MKVSMKSKNLEIFTIVTLPCYPCAHLPVLLCVHPGTEEPGLQVSG